MANSTTKSGSLTICCISGVMGIALEVDDMMIMMMRVGLEVVLVDVYGDRGRSEDRYLADCDYDVLV